MKKSLLLIVALVVSATGLFAQTISVGGGPILNSGDPIVVNYTGGTGSPLDWIGIYPKDTVPDGTPPSNTWQYIATPAGSFTFSDPLPNNGAATLPNGEYDVHLFCCDLYQSLAKTTITIQGAAPATVDLPRWYSTADDSISIQYSGGTGSPTDWIGIYKKGDVPGTQSSQTYLYVPTTAGQITFGGPDWPDLPAGEYVAYLFCCDLYTVLASQEFELFEALAPSLAPVSLVAGGPVLFNFTGGLGNYTDWVGIYRKDTVPDGSPSATTYTYCDGINGSTSMDATALEIGVFYDAHLFCCDGYTILASHKNWQLGPGGAAGEAAAEKSFFTAQPSPAREVVHLVFEESATGRVVFFDLAGKIARVEKMTAAKTLAVRGLESGVYFARFESQKGSQTQKIVVE